LKKSGPIAMRWGKHSAFIACPSAAEFPNGGLRTA
jgi:hypothetical protein